MIISKFECPERTGNYSLTSKCRFKNLIRNVFMTKLGRPERRENHSLTSRCRFINLKVHKSRYVL